MDSPRVYRIDMFAAVGWVFLLKCLSRFVGAQEMAKGRKNRASLAKIDKSIIMGSKTKCRKIKTSCFSILRY